MSLAVREPERVRANHGPQAGERVPPQSAALEMCVLGAIMLEPQEAYPLAAEYLRSDSFYLDGHGLIFTLMGELLARGTPPDSVAVLAELRNRQFLDKVGGSGVIMAMLNAVPTAANVAHHARKVAEMYALRSVIRGCTAIIEDAYRQERSIDELLGDVADLPGLVRERANLRGGELLRAHIEDVSDALVTQAQAQMQVLDDPQSRPASQPTGLGAQLDAMLDGGHMDGDLVTVAGKTGTGKSRLCVWATVDAAYSGHRVGYLSFDMRRPRALAYFGSSIAARLNPDEMLNPRDMLAPDFANLDFAKGRLLAFSKYAGLFTGRVYCVTDGDKSLAALRQYAKFLFEDKGCERLVIDGLYSIPDWQNALNDGRAGDQYRVVAAVKDIAERYKRPVIVMHQLRKEGYDQPSEADLLYGRPLLELSDTLLLLHDEQRRLAGTPPFQFIIDPQTGRSRRPNERRDDMSQVRTETQLVRDIDVTVAKNRGNTGSVCIDFDFRRGCRTTPTGTPVSAISTQQEAK